MILSLLYVYALVRENGSLLCRFDVDVDFDNIGGFFEQPLFDFSCQFVRIPNGHIGVDTDMHIDAQTGRADVSSSQFLKITDIGKGENRFRNFRVLFLRRAAVEQHAESRANDFPRGVHDHDANDHGTDRIEKRILVAEQKAQPNGSHGGNRPMSAPWFCRISIIHKFQTRKFVEILNRS